MAGRWLILLMILCIGGAFFALGQHPKILVLTPNDLKAHKSQKQELESFMYLQKQIASRPCIGLPPPKFRDDTRGEIETEQSERAYLAEADSRKVVTLMAQRLLCDTLRKLYIDAAVKPVIQKSSGAPGELKEIAVSDSANYVLNFSSVAFFRHEDMNAGKFTVEFFDAHSGSILLAKTYTIIPDLPPPGTLSGFVPSNDVIMRMLTALIPEISKMVIDREPVPPFDSGEEK
jgi:hypothetical protein